MPTPGGLPRAGRKRSAAGRTSSSWCYRRRARRTLRRLPTSSQRLDEEIIRLFLELVLICDEMGLIGKEMFADYGCKLPSNASKEWSGTKADFTKKKEKMEEAIGKIVKRHREMGAREQGAGLIERERQGSWPTAGFTRRRTCGCSWGRASTAT